MNGGGDGGVRPGEVADVVVEQVADRAGAEVGPGAAGGVLGVEHLVAEGVEHPRDAGTHAPRAQHLAVHLGSRRDGGLGGAGPLAGQRAVEQAGEVDLVDAGPTGRQAAQRGVHPEADDADLAVLVDQHVLRHEAAVGQAGGVRLGHRVRDLGDQPGRPARRQRTLAGDEDVEGVALAPLVHDVAAPACRLGVEHPEQPSVHDGASAARGLEDGASSLVVGGEQVHGHGPVEDQVVRAPEPAGPVLRQEVVEAVALGEHVTGLHRRRHRSPAFPRRVLDPVLAVPVRSRWPL